VIGVDASTWPPPDEPIGQSIGYHLRTGNHAITAYDWKEFLRFADRRFRNSSLDGRPPPSSQKR